MADELKLKGKILVRRGTKEDWQSSEAILAAGEMGYATDTNELFIGDGQKSFGQLTPIGDSSTIQELLAEKADKEEVYTKTEVDDKIKNIGGAFEYKGTKNTYEELQEVEDPKLGDVYQVGTDKKDLYVYDGDSFEPFGSGEIDLSGKVDKTVTSDKGTSEILNSNNGSSLVFTDADGKVVGRVAVHDGSEENIRVQLMSGPVSEDNHCEGPVITLLDKIATYRSEKHTDKELSDPSLEIATLADIQEVNGFVKETVEGTAGLAQIINETTGGSLLYEFSEHEGGTRKISRVSVHDGSGNDVMAQIVAGVHDESNHCLGTTISVFEDKATYRSKANADKAIKDEDLEIATIGDIKKVNGYVQEVIKAPDIGEAIIKNDETGGGIWFKRDDGVESYVGVNNGEKANDRPTPMAQLYAADSETKKDGSFLNVFQDRITYNNRKRAQAGAKNGDTASEIATVHDVAMIGPRYLVGSLLDGTRVSMHDKEIRVMFKKDTQWVDQNGSSTSENYSKDKYYFSVKFYAPSDDVTGFKEGSGDTVEDKEFDFTDEFSGIDEMGRKYSIVWFPAAEKKDGQWSYFGKDSTNEKYLGWTHTIEWLKGKEIIASDSVRINLSNEECHNTIKPFYVTDPFAGKTVVLDGGSATDTE